MTGFAQPHGWSALVLAGGAGRRFGGGKLVADLDGVPVIRRVTDRAVCAGFAEVVVVTGADGLAVRAVLDGSACRVIEASDWAEGMAATLRAGIAALDPAAAGVCVFLGDMPMVPEALCAHLVRSAQAHGFAARPRHDGKPGHPVAFTRAAFADLQSLEGDEGAAALFKARPERIAYCDTADPGVLMDVDTPADLAAIAAACAA